MEQVYTAQEAIRKLGLSRSTFYYFVRDKRIPAISVPLSKQQYYPKDVIDTLAAERDRILRGYIDNPERLQYVIPSLEDLNQLIEIERTVWGDLGIIAPEQIMARYPYNPNCIHVLKDREEQRVLGSVTMSRMPRETIDALIHLQKDESEITPAEYLPYTKDEPQDCYIVSIIACQGLETEYIGADLLKKTMLYLINLAQQGIVIQHLYTVATTEDGERLAKELGFSEIQRGKGPLGDNRQALILDLAGARDSSKLVRLYQSVLRNRTRRAKRQEKANSTQQTTKS